MKHYELLCVLPGTLAENELTPAVETMKTLLSGEGATEISVEDKGKNRLTYPMKHIRYGYFYFFVFQAEVDQIGAIQKKLSLSKDFLRTLINTYNPEKAQKHAEAMARIEKRSVEFSRLSTSKGVATSKPTSPVKERTEEKKVDMKEINEKLDALLEGDLSKV